MTSDEWFMSGFVFLCFTVFCLGTCSMRAAPTPFDYQRRALVIWGYKVQSGPITYSAPTLYAVPK